MATFIRLTRVMKNDNATPCPCTVNVESIQSFERCSEESNTDGYKQTIITFNDGSAERFNESKEWIEDRLSHLGPDAFL